jgi:hypothetical protein
MVPVPEIIDPVFTKTSQNARFLLSENERFGLVFVKTGSINSGTVLHQHMVIAICKKYRENIQNKFKNLQRDHWEIRNSNLLKILLVIYKP